MSNANNETSIIGDDNPVFSVGYGTLGIARDASKQPGPDEITAEHGFGVLGLAGKEKGLGLNT